MKNLYKALAAFQQEVPHIYKGTQGYSYKYADWGQILDVINPLMQKHGLGFTQVIEGTNITTHLFHSESGEAINGTAEVPQGVQLKGMNDFQILGSGITYIRRYALSAMLGLVTDEDADAAGEQVKPKATKEIRNRPEEAKANPEPMGDDTKAILARAKKAINDELTQQNYITVDAKRAFIKKVLEKDTIDNLDDAELVMQQLENEA